MGASSWWYVVPFHPDLGEVLRDLHRRVLASHEYYLDREPAERWPETLEEVWAHRGVEYDGTHSILDISTVIGSDDTDDFATLRPLRAEELVHYFGSPTPSLAELDAREEDLTFHGERWSGFAAAAHNASGEPEHWVIWGRSGD